jgi:subtilisin family serine protease
MRRSRFVALSILPLLAACADGPGGVTTPEAGQEAAPLYLAKQGGGITGQYIVVLESAEPEAIVASARVRPLHLYHGGLSGFAAKLNTAQLDAVRRTPGVAFVEQDQISRISATRVIPATGAWGLDRIDQHPRGLSGTYTYNYDGTGVHVYVLDTGIQYTHPEFGGRASMSYDAFGGTGEDCHGHGTHVAGTIGGTNVGVANAVTLHGVRVLDCSGNGTNSGIVAAMDWLRVNRVRPAVANMSLGGGYSKAVNVAVDQMYSNGIFVVVAAGNSAVDACDVSPASAVFAMTVAAVDSTDARASFSNWGRCTQMYAPGVNILSSYLGSAYAYMSGTSMASPHVAGVAALYYDKEPAITLATLRTRFVDNNTTKSVVRLNDPGTVMYGTPNKLLYTNGL